MARHNIHEVDSDRPVLRGSGPFQPVPTWQTMKRRAKKITRQLQRREIRERLDKLAAMQINASTYDGFVSDAYIDSIGR